MRASRAFKYFALLSLFFFVTQRQAPLSDSYIGKDVSSILSAIPKSDRNHLEYFFTELIAWDAFGYVLLGEKPMALGGSRKKKPFTSFSGFKESIMPRQIKFDRGFVAWKKYEKFFPMTSFEIFYEDDCIMLVNKKNFEKIIRDHEEDFKNVLNRHINAKGLLNEAKTKPFLSEVLMNHEGLLGTLLGYGRNNAFFFQKKEQLNSDQEKTDFCENLGLDSAWTEKEFSDFSEQFQSVSWVSTYITGAHMKNLKLMTLPGFLAKFDSEETQSLRNQYKETKKVIISYYKDKDFLETTLRLLTSVSR